MATVRITDELRHHIQRAATEVFAKEYKGLEKTMPADMGVQIYNVAFSEYRSRIKAIPHAMFDLRQDLRVNKVGDRNVEFSFEFPSQLPMPLRRMMSNNCIMDRWSWALPGMGVSKDWDPIVQELFKYNDAHRAIGDRQKHFDDNLRKLLNSHTTLGPVVKKWPAVIELVPSRYIRQMKEKPPPRPRQSREVYDVESDALNGMTTEVVRHKLTKDSK